ncbi:MAG: hypothetical protein APR63_03430 [Desulfuromonas sp. SDB]|nr:MAG: hypothetical protein APR63_03430 [Desulfuromonas sp. SDB]
MTAAIEYCHAGSRELAELSKDIGLILYHLSRYNESIEHIEKAIEISQRNKYQDALAKAYNNLAMNLNCLGKYDQALKDAFKALKLKQDIPNFSETSIANTYTVIGDIYRRMNKLYDSIDYHTKALKIYNKQNNISGKAGQICNIGSIYYHLKEFNKAMDNFKEALKLSEKSGNKEFTANIIYNLGSVYRDIGDLNRALEMYNKSILMNRDMGDINAVADALIEISIIYSTQNNDDKALKTNMEAEKIANKINDRKLRKNLHERFYEIYKSMGQFEKSLYHYKIYLKIKQEMSINIESS